MAEKKKKEEQKAAGSPAWMTTYGDMMTLLLCFFVLLVSMSTMEVEKMRAAAASLRGALGVLPYQEQLTPSPIQPPPSPARGESRRGRRSQAVSRLRQVVRELNLENVIRVRETNQGVHITIGDPALFDSGRADIKGGVLPVLNQIVDVVNTGDEIIRVEGHTDNVPIHNSVYDNNWELSIARALSVVRYIQGQQPDIDPGRLRPVGCGEFHPVATNRNEEGRALNRRVEIYIDMDN